jgi:acetyl-CoA carboxylase biotin carboxyl carrier protein
VDLKEIEKLMQALEKSKITRLAIRKEGFEIELEKEAIVVTPAQRISAVEPLALEAPPVTTKPEGIRTSEKVEAEGKYITSPMVGTFYLTPAPGDPAFVKVGDSIDESSVVGIIEAMKVMNEIKSQVKGKIAEILVKSGEPVEFGTKLFRVV